MTQQIQQCKYYLKLGRVRVTIVKVEKQLLLHILSVFLNYTKKKYKQYKYNLKLGRVRVTTVAVEK